MTGDWLGNQGDLETDLGDFDMGGDSADAGEVDTDLGGDITNPQDDAPPSAPDDADQEQGGHVGEHPEISPRPETEFTRDPSPREAPPSHPEGGRPGGAERGW